jgi:hypothetical protein
MISDSTPHLTRLPIIVPSYRTGIKVFFLVRRGSGEGKDGLPLIPALIGFQNFVPHSGVFPHARRLFIEYSESIAVNGRGNGRRRVVRACFKKLPAFNHGCGNPAPRCFENKSEERFFVLELDLQAKNQKNDGLNSVFVNW